MHARTWSLAAAEHHAEAQRALLRLVLCGRSAGRDVHHAQRRVATVRAAEAGEQAANDLMPAHTLAAVPLHYLMLACRAGTGVRNGAAAQP